MTIRSSPTENELKMLFAARSPEKAEVFDRLCGSGCFEPELCFIAEEGDKPLGALVIVSGRSGSTDIAFAACTLYEGEHTLSQLYLRAFAQLRERGTGYLFTELAESESKLYYERLGWKWIVELGFVPPTLDEASLRCAGRRLLDGAEPSGMPLELPPQLGISVPECRFTAEYRVSRGQHAENVYTTRSRRRLGERAALIVFLIAVIAAGNIRGSSYYVYLLRVVPMLGIGMVLLWRNIFIPLRVRASAEARMREHGHDSTDDRYFFGSERFICFTRGRGSAIVSYDNIRIVYDKPHHIFLCSRSGRDSANGWFVSSDSLSDKQAFFELIRQHSHDVRFRH